MYSRRNKLNKKVRYVAERLVEVEKLLKASQENQDHTLVHDISVSLGTRRCKNLGS